MKKASIKGLGLYYTCILKNILLLPIPPFPRTPLENTLPGSSFHQNFEETKGYIRIVEGFFFRGPKKCVEKSNPSESKRKEKLNGTCFSCIAHLSREL